MRSILRSNCRGTRANALRLLKNKILLLFFIYCFLLNEDLSKDPGSGLVELAAYDDDASKYEGGNVFPDDDICGCGCTISTLCTTFIKGRSS